MSGFKSFTVAGAGNLGKYIIEELLKLQQAGKVTSVGFLSRQVSYYVDDEVQNLALNNLIIEYQASGNDDLIAKGAKRLVVDYSSPASLSTALSGTDVVVTTIRASPDSYASHIALAKASKEAGVKLYVPSDFGSPASSKSPLFDKDKFRNGTLRELDLPYATFHTGPFADLVLAPCVLVDLMFTETLTSLFYLALLNTDSSLQTLALTLQRES